jgi:hypothetical protein
MSARIGALLAAAALVVVGGLAKLAHLGPFADDAIRSLDTVAMSTLEFRNNYQAFRSGTLAEKQGVDIACALFSSLANTGAPPAEWKGFDDALADRMGVTNSDEYLTGKLKQLEVTVDLAEHNVRAAAQYAKACVL